MEFSTSDKAFILTPEEMEQVGRESEQWPSERAQELYDRVNGIIEAAITADMDPAHAGVQHREQAAANHKRLQLLAGMRKCVIDSGALDLAVPDSPKEL